MEEIVPVALKEKKGIMDKLWPLLLTLGIFVLDQGTKFLIVKFITPYTIGASFLNGFLRIVHVSNNAIAFSIGSGLPDIVRYVSFAIIPLLVLFIVLIVYFRSDDFSTVQRWCICGIMGGGFGNIFDRFFRTEGVVDFIDFRFFGIFGFERFPTFNIADMSIVISGILLLISFIMTFSEDSKEKKEEGDK